MCSKVAYYHFPSLYDQWSFIFEIDTYNLKLILTEFNINNEYNV